MKRVIYLLCLLSLLGLACVTPAALPASTPPLPKAALAAALPTATPHTMTVCVVVDTVRLRDGAGTSASELAVLTAGDVVVITGKYEISEDGGVWWPVEFEGVHGWINARYLCE